VKNRVATNQALVFDGFSDQWAIFFEVLCVVEIVDASYVAVKGASFSDEKRFVLARLAPILAPVHPLNRRFVEIACLVVAFWIQIFLA